MHIQDTHHLTFLLSLVMYHMHHPAELFLISCVNDISPLFSLFFKQLVGGKTAMVHCENDPWKIMKMTLENSYINFRD